MTWVRFWLGEFRCAGPALAVLFFMLSPVEADAHAALARSDPAAGAVLAEPPAEMRLWFTEPLEVSYTAAKLLDSAGTPVSGVTFAVAPESAHQLVVVPPPDLPDGGYTVAWRTLSAADGHTLQGYFGFTVGAGVVDQVAPVAPQSSGLETIRALSKGLALLGLAAVAAIAPMMLGVLGPAAQAVSGFGGAMRMPLRRYGVVAAVLALVGSVAALGAQAAAVVPEAFLPVAMAKTLADTRYGQLMLLRLTLLVLCLATVALALRGRDRWRQPALIAGVVVAIVLPLPFSLLSHAAAQGAGRTAAVFADALHLLAASIWAGGLLMMVLMLLPALRPLPVEKRRAVLRAAIPRFSAIGLAAWGVLALTGLYAAWLQVGTIAALVETPYGQSLLLKAALLLPVLALAAFHLLLGRTNLQGRGGRFAITNVAEAALVIAVMLIVGRLIGQEPAREALASRTPPQIVAPLTFATNDGDREGRLEISPGATGTNTFTLAVDGEALPAGAEGVLRFELSDRAMGAQELLLPATGQNRFQAAGPELSLPGTWRIEAITRVIGAFSWATETVVPIDETPPPVSVANPAPLFRLSGIAGMIAVTIGMAGLAAAEASHGAPRPRRNGVAAAGVLALAAGAVILTDARIPLPEPGPPVIARQAPMTAASPDDVAHDNSMMDHHDHASPVAASATPEPLPGPGTAVSKDGISVTISADPVSAGPVAVTIDITDADGSPLTDARAVVLSDMPDMAMGRTETPAVESGPGRYLAESVPLGMAGEWRLAVRVSPKGAATQVFTFAVPVP